MSKPGSAIADYTVRPLELAEHEPDQAATSVVHKSPGGANVHGTVTMRMKAGTTAAVARSTANTLRAREKGLRHLEAPADAAA